MLKDTIEILELLLDTKSLKDTEGFWIDIVPAAHLGEVGLRANVYNVRKAFITALQVLRRVEDTKLTKLLEDIYYSDTTFVDWEYRVIDWKIVATALQTYLTGGK